MSEALKRLRAIAVACKTPGTAIENAESRSELEDTFDATTVLALLDIAEAAQAVAQEGAHPPMGEWIRRMQMLRAALAKLEAP